MTAGEAMTQTLAANTRSRRIRAGLKQRELARAMGVSHPVIGQIERGQRNTTMPVLLKLARALGVTPGKLLAPPECGHCGDTPPAGYACLLCGRHPEAAS